ncbi:MAG: Daunorubicin/doxorubicin resistance ATP-binding protein DrrA [Firmicutes bacterium ADurb.Bin356]|nr:MAG: Daunorubicin/doxorubicin resistance ATP-binding protein DrrA [Firmicutes bacterium ADurb.Bin356]
MVVKTENLVKRYGNVLALDHLNLEVNEGEVFGFLGPNGSGKTTAINCILSLLKFDKGKIEVFGKPMSPDAYSIKRDIGIIMQDVAVFDELTVEQNIDYFSGLYIREKERRAELLEEALEFVGLSGFRKYYPKKLSGGLLRRLNIACGIAHKPKLIIFDEPTVGVDPQSRNNILEGILKLNRQGATVIYTSHYMEEVEQICSRIAILDKGRIVASGTKESLKAMIKTGEKITVECYGTCCDDALSSVKGLSGIISAYCEDEILHIKAGRSNCLAGVLERLNKSSIAYGRIYCELPTLNDVFLEITGKHLRDKEA